MQQQGTQVNLKSTASVKAELTHHHHHHKMHQKSTEQVLQEAPVAPVLPVEPSVAEQTVQKKKPAPKSDKEKLKEVNVEIDKKAIPAEVEKKSEVKPEGEKDNAIVGAIKGIFGITPPAPLIPGKPDDSKEGDEKPMKDYTKERGVIGVTVRANAEKIHQDRPRDRYPDVPSTLPGAPKIK